MLKKFNLFAIFILICSLFLHFHSYAEELQDPYEWLEDMDSPQTLEWVQRQNAATDLYFHDSEKLNGIMQRLIEITDTERIGLPTQRESNLFYSVQKKGQKQSVFAMRATEGIEKILVDPNLIDEKGNHSLTHAKISETGRYLVYGISNSGSDVETWYFLDLETGNLLQDELSGMKFSSLSWTQDDRGIYYTKFLQDNIQGIFFHSLGSKQDEDRCVSKQKDYMIHSLQLIKNDEYVLFSMQKGCDKNNGVFTLNVQTHEVNEIFPPGQATYQLIEEKGDQLFFLTSAGAPRHKVIAVDLTTDKESLVIPNSKDVLTEVILVKDRLICNYMKDCTSTLCIFDLQGNLKNTIRLSAMGTIHLAKSKTSTFFFSFSNFVTPSTIYQYDLNNNELSLFFQPLMDWDPEEYVTHQVFFPSKDGTNIPLFITHKKGIPLNGNTPTLMYGYGGFNFPITPQFSPLQLAWLERGGIYASVCLRGGGEYGPEWHRMGSLHHKQNVFDDFISAGEWLISHGYTQPKHLGINGRSNGGLLVGACLVQRPDLFGAAVPQVGVLDMLKFHKFTIGWAWMSDYGNPEDINDYPYLLSYSPYHNVKPNQQYPACLITTSDHDDRVVPLHSFKFAARLQECQKGDSPVLLRVYPDSGHGAGRSLGHIVREYAEILYFLDQELNDSNEHDSSSNPL
ncbi:MAG: prolyl oligopeptidase family serine peptidase [Chlamydiales bacterium]